eukprot:gene16135-7497_t
MKQHIAMQGRQIRMMKQMTQKRKVKFGGRVGQRKEKIEMNVGNHGDIETEIITTERDKESDSLSEEKSLPSGDEGCQNSQSWSIEKKQNLAIKELEKHFICSLVRHEKNSLTIKVIPVQQQKDSVNCGLFAIAFAHYIVVHKEYPSSVNFNQMVMRHHILCALAANQLDLFPTTNEEAKQNADKIIEVDLYCT